jgi:dienelactone hydrolase
LPVSHPAVNVWTVAATLALVSFPLASACSSSTVDGVSAGAPSVAGQTGSSPTNGGVGVGGSTPTAGAGAPGGGTGTGGAVATGGSAGSVGTGGASGGVGGSAGGTAGSASGGTSGADPCGMPPTHPLKVVAAVGEHTRDGAGLDNRAKTMLGKLVIDYGVAGGDYISFLAKRGYHSIGAPGFAECNAPDLDGDRTRVSKCRLGEITATDKAIKAKVAQLQAKYPEEDWGYFLDASGNLRWSDIAVTGFSHGATTAAVTARSYACVWRAVSRSGPRDDTCGKGPCGMPLSASAYDAACTNDKIASWLDEPSKTPMDHFYGIAGMSDGQCGDIMFNMHHTMYPGEPTVFDMAGADISTTHQFFSSGVGHSGFFDYGPAEAALEIAFGIPPENRHPNF